MLDPQWAQSVPEDDALETLRILLEGSVEVEINGAGHVRLPVIICALVTGGSLNLLVRMNSARLLALLNAPS